jgi:hypothetical protein
LPTFLSGWCLMASFFIGRLDVVERGVRRQPQDPVRTCVHVTGMYSVSPVRLHPYPQKHRSAVHAQYVCRRSLHLTQLERCSCWTMPMHTVQQRCLAGVWGSMPLTTHYILKS